MSTGRSPTSLKTTTTEISNDNDKPNLPKRGDRFIESFKTMFMIGFCIIVACGLGSFALATWAFYGSPELRGGVRAIMMIRLVQISFGMIIGFFTVYMGVVAAWMGIESQYKITGQHNDSRLALVSASPGILLMICGTIVLMICLLKPVSVPLDREELQRFLAGDTAPNEPLTRLDEHNEMPADPPDPK